MSGHPPVTPESGSEIIVSDDEQRCGSLSARHRMLAGVFLHCRGFVVLRRALPVALVDQLRSSFTGIYDECRTTKQNAAGRFSVARTTGAVFWERASRLRIFPRLEAPFNDVRVVANPFAVPVMRDLLGDDFYCKSVSSDTCANGAILQSPHRDLEYYKGNESYGSVVNIPLMHCGLHNGPLEVWPSSQFWNANAFGRHGVSPFVQDDRNPAIEELAGHFPSQFIELWPGDLLVRDPGMWHRGTPNPTAEPRVMLTLAYFRRDYDYGYGHARLNLDGELFDSLAAPVRNLLEHSFRQPEASNIALG